jgi:uncharacterized cupin superfamily protein
VPSYSIADVDQLPAEGPGGAVKKVRRALGARAFGFNYFELPAGAEGHEHDETASGQEEVIFVVGGSGRLRVDGDEVELKPGRFVRLDASARRCPVAGDEPPGWG